MRILFFLLFPIFLSAQINRAYGVIEINSFPTSSSTGPKFAYRPVDSSFYRWVSGNTWVKVIPDGSSGGSDTLYLKQLSGTTALVNGDTIDISMYLLHSDTTSMLLPYIKLAGWGLLKTSHTLTVDSSKVASRYYVSTLGFGAGTTNRVPLWTSSTVLGNSNIQDNGTVVSILNSKPFALGQWTTAGRPTGTSGYMGWNTTLAGIDWYNGTRWAIAREASAATGIANRVLFNDANGQITDDAGITYSATGSLNLSGSSVVQGYGLDITSSITTNSSGSVGGVNIRPTLAYSSGSNPAAYGINVNPTFSGSFGGGYAGIVIQAKSQYAGFGSAGLRINTSSSNGIFIQGTSGRALIELSPSNSTTPSVAVLAASDNNFLGFTVQRNTTTVGVKTGMSLASIPSGVVLSQVSVQLAAELAVNNGTASYQDFLINTVRGSSSTEQLRIKGQSGFIGLGNNPNYKLDVTSTDAIGLPRGTVAQRPTIVSSTTPFRYNTDSTALEYGESVGTWRLLATRAYARSLVPTTFYTGDGSVTGLRTVSLGGSRGDYFKLNGTSNGKDLSYYFAADGVYSNESFGSVANMYRTNNQNNGSYTTINNYIYGGGNGNFSSALNFGATRSSTLSTSAYYNTDVRRGSGSFVANYTAQIDTNGRKYNYLSYKTDSSTTGGRKHIAGFAYKTISSGNNNIVAASPSFLLQTIFYNSATKFDWIRVDNLDTDTTSNRVTLYNNKYAFTNSRPGTGKNLMRWDNGTPAFVEQKRDTTVFVTADTDYDWSAAISTANISSRFNRVIIHLTLTSGAGDYNTVTLHTPDANLMQCEYIIRGTDNSGSYSNEISFGTNNAISSDGTDASGYTLSAGQGLHVRVVYNGSAYKYIYY